MIDLIKLKLDGWMSYDKVVIKLDNEGITFIKGPIGAGKSAIFEAIFYLLFGKTLRKKDSINSLINKILNHGYDIALKFTLDGKEYVIREIRDRDPHGLYFKINGKDKRGKTDPETRKIILKELGMTADDFRSIAFLGQRQTQILVEGGETDRAKALVDIFGLNRYDDLISDCDADLKTALAEKKELNDLRDQSQQDFESLEQSLLEDDDEDEEVDPKEIDRIDTKIETIQTSISKIRTTTEKINKVIGRISTMDKDRDYIEKLKKEIKKLKKELKKYPKPSHGKAKLQKLIEDLQHELADANQKMKQAKQAIKSAKSMTNICPVSTKTCPVDIPVKYSKQIIRKATQVKIGAEKATKSLTKDIKRVQNDYENLQKYKSIKTTIKDKTDTINTIQIDEDLPTLTEETNRLRKLKSKIDKATKRLEKLRNKKNEITTALAVAEEKEAMREKINNTLVEKENAVRELTKQLTTKSVEAQYLAGALAIFKKMKMYKIDLVLKLLNSHLKDILEKISDGEYKAEFISQKRSADKRKILDKVGILVYDSYKMLPIELCSGGQSTEVGLAVLLSTWKTANSISQKGVSSLWLDEVFGPLNEEIINRVFDSVIDIVSELGTTSVKLISHRELDPRLFDYFWNIKRKHGISILEVE
jgi:DNA repair exonuclease SbcCD ATPase subunit